MIYVDENDIAQMSDEDQRRETFAYFGFACYQAQCVERQLAILLSTTEFPEIDPKISQAFEEYLDKSFEKTLGQLLKRAKELVFSDELVNRLSVALEKRNWLAHRYFWERATALLTRQGRTRMILELAEVANFLCNVDEELSEICSQWYDKHGITETIIATFLEISLAKESES